MTCARRAATASEAKRRALLARLLARRDASRQSALGECSRREKWRENAWRACFQSNTVRRENVRARASALSKNDEATLTERRAR